MELGCGNIAFMATKIRKGAKLHLYLEERMVSRGFTDATLSTALETSPTTVWRWRKGKQRPSDNDIARIALVLDCEPIQLYELPQPKNKRPSLDAKLAQAPDEVAERIHQLVDAILKTGS
jgi:transcriptional regulator with XRE-family HTH domain